MMPTLAASSVLRSPNATSTAGGARRRTANTSRSQIKNKPAPARRTLSCLPCREHKLKCNRSIPCESCLRRGREKECQLNPPPSTALDMISRRSRDNRVQCNSWSPGSSAEAVSPRSNGTAMSTFKENLNGAIAPHPVVDTLKTSARSNKPISPSSTIDSAYDAVNQQSVPQGSRPEIKSAQMLMPWATHSTKLADQGERLQAWRQYLVSQVPSRFQCDMLVSYYFEHIDYIFQAIHVPSFREESNNYWTSDKTECDIIWLSLLYIILAVSGLHIPSHMEDILGMDGTAMKTRCENWFCLSRQALQAGGFEVKPSSTALQTFVVSQLYLYGTRDIEMLNSLLGQAVRNAQALGLDKITEAPKNLKEEMKIRIWWDICDADTSQSISLNRQPMIQSSLSKVPFQSNCNDDDLTKSTIKVQPMDKPTIMSMNIIRTKLLKVTNGLFRDNGALLNSYDFVCKIENEIQAILTQYSWFLQTNDDGSFVILPKELNHVNWQHHIVWTFVCVQRIRMFRPFIRTRPADAWPKCIQAAESAFKFYISIREQEQYGSFKRSPKFRSQVFQNFQVSVTLAMLLLVERPRRWQKIRADLEIVISDLEMLEDETVPVAARGRAVLRQILALYETTCQDEISKSADLLPEIQAVFGGEETTRETLKNLTIDGVNKAGSHLVSDDPFIQDLGMSFDAMEDETSFPVQADEEFFLPTNGDFGNEISYDVQFDLLDWTEWEVFLAERNSALYNP